MASAPHCADPRPAESYPSRWEPCLSVKRRNSSRMTLDCPNHPGRRGGQRYTIKIINETTLQKEESTHSASQNKHEPSKSVQSPSDYHPDACEHSYPINPVRFSTSTTGSMAVESQLGRQRRRHVNVNPRRRKDVDNEARAVPTASVESIRIG